MQLEGSALFVTGDTVTGLALHWRALDAGVVEVSPQGQVTARAEGQAKVEGSHGSHADTLLVVVRPTVARVEVEPAGLTLSPGAGAQLSASPRDANGNPVAGRVVVWSSSRPDIAEVDPATGQVQAKAVGAAIITATADGVSGTLAVAVENPAPVLTGLSPSQTSAGGPEFTLVVAGQNFVAGSQVHWNGSPRSTQVVSGNGLRVTITAADIAEAGGATVTVVTPAPGGGVSNGLAFTINVRPNPVPVVAALDPSTAVARSGDVELRITGHDFSPGAVVRWNGADRPTRHLGETELRATIPGSDLMSAGSAAVTVFNPSPGGGLSNAQPFAVTAAPAIQLASTTISFGSAPGGADPAAETVAVTNGGTGTLSGLSATIGYGSGQPTGWLSAALSGTTAPATLTLQASTGTLAPGTYTATVVVSSPVASNDPQAVSLALTVSNPQPSLESLRPDRATAGGAGFTLTVLGSDFAPGAMVSWNGAERATTVVSASEVRADISATDIASAGTARVSVFNPGPGGGPSSTLAFEIEPPPGRIAGTVRNAVDGAPVTGATITLRAGGDASPNDPVLATTSSDGSGQYSFDSLPAGAYTIFASASGFISQVGTGVTVASGATTMHGIVLSPEIGEGEVRVVLTWGEVPRDLDAHLTGPLATGGEFHVYWADPGSLESPPHAALDIDQVEGFGPETITIARRLAGTYRFHVRDFTNGESETSSELSRSGALVRVYSGAREVGRYAVPGEPGTLWTVFEIDGSTGAITPVNRMTFEYPVPDEMARSRQAPRESPSREPLRSKGAGGPRPR